MKKITILIIFLCLPFAIFSESKLFEGKLDSSGKMLVDFNLPEKKAFIIQAYVFYRKSWRPIKIFWNTSKIWSDLGPAFKTMPYRIHILIN